MPQIARGSVLQAAKSRSSRENSRRGKVCLNSNTGTLWITPAGPVHVSGASRDPITADRAGVQQNFWPRTSRAQLQAMVDRPGRGTIADRVRTDRQAAPTYDATGDSSSAAARYRDQNSLQPSRYRDTRSEVVGAAWHRRDHVTSLPSFGSTRRTTVNRNTTELCCCWKVAEAIRTPCPCCAPKRSAEDLGWTQQTIPTRTIVLAPALLQARASRLGLTGRGPTFLMEARPRSWMHRHTRPMVSRERARFLSGAI